MNRKQIIIAASLLSRRNSDYYIETSLDGVDFHQMRTFHLDKGDLKVKR